jgi:hypothetical protein
MFAAVNWGDVLLVTVGAVAAGASTLANTIFNNRHARRMEDNRRRHERITEDERRKVEAADELVDICADFLTRATSVVRQAIERAEQQRSWDNPLAEFESVYALGNRLRLRVSEPVADATERVMDALDKVYYHWSIQRTVLIAKDGRNKMWEQFERAAREFRDTARLNPSR